MDDAEAEGNLFSYEKLFGAKEMSDTDFDNEKQGKDNSVSRTRRLFYVACTRAKDSLALVAYTQDKELVKKLAGDAIEQEQISNQTKASVGSSIITILIFSMADAKWCILSIFASSIGDCCIILEPRLNE